MEQLLITKADLEAELDTREAELEQAEEDLASAEEDLASAEENAGAGEDGNLQFVAIQDLSSDVQSLQNCIIVK